MNKFIISVIGPDRPGIIAAVSDILFRLDCNIENVSQTILQNQFGGFFIASVPLDMTAASLKDAMMSELERFDQFVHIKPLDSPMSTFQMGKSDPFIITTKGPDCKGLVAGITSVIAQYGVNVTNLQAVFKGGDDPEKNIMIYEVDIPESVDINVLRTDLRDKAAQLGLNISIQHRDIFLAINRI
jgi:glycine cleavage system transcriptional repressor